MPLGFETHHLIRDDSSLIVASLIVGGNGGVM